jgi:mannose-6-phosphate isomerase-like protein (cupin superfamily)
LVQAVEVVGAMGVSGASSADEDQELAVIGAQAAAAAASDGNPNGAAYFPSKAIKDRFEEGGLLLDTPGYKIDAGRRDAPGEVEYHERVVDVMRVVEGKATVITGGELVNPRQVSAGELRAESIDGGTEHELSEGDVLAVPNGVPHQFVSVSDPFLYFVVKVEA